MAISYAEFKKNPLVLAPVEVKLSFLDEPILIHQFTMAQMQVIDAENDGDAEKNIRKQVLRFLSGFDVSINDDDINELGELFTGWQVREIYLAAIKLNGYGPSALREAEKN